MSEESPILPTDILCEIAKYSKRLYWIFLSNRSFANAVSHHKIKKQYLDLYANDIQKQRFEKICNRVIRGHSLILHSAGGCGKSTTLKQVVNHLRDNHRYVIHCTATTGIAAINLSDSDVLSDGVNAKTFHQWAGIGLGEQSAEKLYASLALYGFGKWKKVQILVIEEISMMSAELFDKMDKLAKMIRCNDLPFGGIQLIVLGDFLQLPPVNGRWVFESKAWQSIDWKPIGLYAPFRYTDLSFYFLLSRVRFGVPTKDDITRLMARTKAYQQYLKCAETIAETDMICPTLLYSTNFKVDEYNNSKLKAINKPLFTYRAIDRYHERKGRELDEQTQINLEKKADKMISPEIHLKEGAQVMLTRNTGGYANGSRGVIVSLLPDAAYVQFRQSVVLVAFETWEIKAKRGILIRNQIPLRLAWASTIHRSQGQTLDYAIEDLGSRIFTRAQSYVALSRVRDLQGLFLINFDPKKIIADRSAIKYIRHLEKLEQKQKDELYGNAIRG